MMCIVLTLMCLLRLGLGFHVCFWHIFSLGPVSIYLWVRFLVLLCTGVIFYIRSLLVA